MSILYKTARNVRFVLFRKNSIVPLGKKGETAKIYDYSHDAVTETNKPYYYYFIQFLIYYKYEIFLYYKHLIYMSRNKEIYNFIY